MLQFLSFVHQPSFGNYGRLRSILVERSENSLQPFEIRPLGNPLVPSLLGSADLL